LVRDDAVVLQGVVPDGSVPASRNPISRTATAS
jgi:hypothetical protein